MRNWQKIAIGIFAFASSLVIGLNFSPFGRQATHVSMDRTDKMTTVSVKDLSKTIEQRAVDQDVVPGNLPKAVQSVEERRRIEFENAAGDEILFPWDSWLKLLNAPTRGIEIESSTINARGKLLLISGFGHSDRDVNAFQTALQKLGTVSSVQIVSVGQSDGKNYPLRFDLRVSLE